MQQTIPLATGLDYSKIKWVPKAVAKAVATEEEKPKPIVVFEILDCVVPLTKRLEDPFNEGFYLIANVILYEPATLFVGVRSGDGAVKVLGTTDAVCASYPGEGILDMKWLIGQEPTMAEFLELLGYEPLLGKYQFSFVTGFTEEGTPVPTDEIMVTVEITEKPGRDYKPLVGLAALTAVGATVYVGSKG
jgi:hypothetical protein